MTNDRGLIIEHFIRLGPQEASLFWWCLAGFSCLLALYALLLGIGRIVKPQTLAVDSSGLTIPYGMLLSSRAHVKFSEIQSVSEGTIQGVIFLKLKTRRRTYYISPSYLPSPNDYDEIKAAIAFAMLARQTAGGSDPEKTIPGLENGLNRVAGQTMLARPDALAVFCLKFGRIGTIGELLDGERNRGCDNSPD